MKKTKSLDMTIRLVSLLLCFSVLLYFCGCFSNSYYYPDVAKGACFEVYHALLNGDKEKLKSLLCEDLQNQDDVDEQIDEFMDAIGGKLVSADEDSYHYDKLGASRDYGETDEYTILNTYSELKNIDDNNNNTYASLGVAYFHYNEKNPGKIGIYAIDLSKDGSYRTYAIAHNDHR